MSGQEFLDRLTSQFGEAITGSNFENVDPWVEVAPDGLVDVCTYLRDEADLRFDMLNCISGVDYFEADEKKAAKTGWDPHTEVVYHLSSTVHKHNIVLKVILPRWHNDTEGVLPQCPSVESVWKTADWHEREVYDLSGVEFTDHPNMCRILCPEDWIGHPLRRDYEMPLEYHGMRGR